MSLTNRLLIVFLLLTAALMCLQCDEDFQETAPGGKTALTVAQASYNQKIGQLFCFTIDPVKYFLYMDYRRNVQTLLRTYRPGGIYFSTALDSYSREVLNEFNGEKLLGEISEMNEFLDIPLLISADFENGAWFWDNNATVFPYPLALGATNSPELSYRQGKITGAEAKIQGINWVFAPIMNTTEPPDNLLFKIRSLGENPDMVGAIGAGFIKGCQDVGIATCMKYYPYASRLSRTVPRVDESQLALFKAGIDAGVFSILGPPVVANSAADSLTARSDNIIRQLRDNLGFSGVVVTELSGLDLPAEEQEGFSSITASLEAGIDVFILPEILHDTVPLLDFLLLQAEEGKLDMQPIERAVENIFAMKNNLRLQEVDYAYTLHGTAGLGVQEYYQTSQDISNASVTLLKNEDDIIPLNPEQHQIIAISFLDDLSAYDGVIYTEKINLESENIKHLGILGDPDKVYQREVIRRASEADIVLCSFFIKPGTDPSNPMVSPELLSLMDRILKTNNNVVVLSLYNPYLINLIPDVKGCLTAYSASETSMDAVLEVLFGKRNPTGKLPVTVSHNYPLGFGLSLPE